ncbi:lipoprotein transporter subunit LolE [Thalassotalea insulae]|uniref:Lipoprotein transporter subunit LolE n=1 Tax=Thalassotalea insulae TaxID=2056778 RepID=A0ABQ6GV44_9GAMM|nr:lipoprotein-releasing ABC transporter permease subunit LolE [Thalassotalea insulae]GLX79800.1 lipoprotein transporter subunit LolE [Thalassotalea insulae]
MFRPVSVFLATRYIGNRQGKGFASFISASSTIGIALGVMILIMVLSAMNGFERALAQHLLSVVPHSELISGRGPVNQWQSNVQKVQQHPDVVAAAPVIKLQGMMQKRDQLKGVEVRAVDPVLEQSVSSIASYLTQGTWLSLYQANHVVLGAGVAKKLGVTLGDTVQMLIPKIAQGQGQQVNINRNLSALAKYNFTVSGIFNFGGEIDNSQAYISLAKGQEIFGYDDDQVQGIRLRVHDVFNIQKITNEAGYILRDYYLYLYNWTRTQGHLYNDIQLVRMVMFIVLVLVIAVASFNIVSTLIMAVNEKRGDIAILKTMGASSSLIMSTFMLQGIVNGVLGSVVGGGLGVYLANNLTEFSQALEHLLGVKFLSGDIYFIDFLPSYVKQVDVIITIMTALVLTLVATIYPAWQATKVEPAQVLGQI